MWADGSPLTVNAFLRGEPNATNTSDDARRRSKNLDWSDAGRGSGKSFLCTE